MNPRVRNVLLILGLASIACSPLMARTSNKRLSTAAQEMQAQARELWEKAIAAKGGRERLRKISSLYVASILSGGDRDYGFYVFPDYSFEYSYRSGRESTAIEVFNHKQAVTWWLPPGGKVGKPLMRYNDDPSSNIIAQFLYLMVTNCMDPTPLRVRRDRIDFQRVDVVEVDANGWRVDYYLDPKTFLPIQAVSDYSLLAHEQGRMDQVVHFEDYVRLDGVMMPRKASYSYRYKNATREWTERLSFELNPPFDPQFFEQPPTAKTTPESWRAKG